MHIVWIKDFIAFFLCNPRPEKIVDVTFLHKVPNIHGMGLFACKVSKTVCIFIVAKVVPVNLKTSDLLGILGKKTKVNRIGVLKH